jgi:hypothetical protein
MVASIRSASKESLDNFELDQYRKERDRENSEPDQHHGVRSRRFSVGTVRNRAGDKAPRLVIRDPRQESKIGDLFGVHVL